MRWLSVLLLCALVGGCFTAGKRGGDTPLAIYDFGQLPASLLAAPRKQPIALEVRAPIWFDSLGIDYRLNYVDSARLREYARARWAGPPAQMIQQRLAQQLGYSVAGQSQARCLLRLEIVEFSQHFMTPEQSLGILQGRVVLLDRSRHQLSELALNLESLAVSQDARGGVGALSATVEQLAQKLFAWEKELAAGGSIRACVD